MSEDIINALRLASDRVKATVGSPNIFDEAANELEKLNAEADRLARRNALLVAEIETVREERDEARRSVCEMSIQLGRVYRRIGSKAVKVTTPEGCAEIMRWDCFKEKP